MCLRNPKAFNGANAKIKARIKYSLLQRWYYLSVYNHSFELGKSIPFLSVTWICGALWIFLLFPYTFLSNQYLTNTDQGWCDVTASYNVKVADRLLKVTNYITKKIKCDGTKYCWKNKSDSGSHCLGSEGKQVLSHFWKALQIIPAFVSRSSCNDIWSLLKSKLKKFETGVCFLGNNTIIFSQDPSWTSLKRKVLN